MKSIIVWKLTVLAKWTLKKYKPEIIAITGSVGKTTTKDAIYQVLRDTTDVRRSEKSFNSEIGLPLTILGLPNGYSNPLTWLTNLLRGLMLVIGNTKYPKLLVLEVGADHPGDIKKVGKWVHPDIAVITRLPETPVHVEYFSSPEEVRKEKAELVRALKKDGVFIANADDSHVLDLRPLTKARCITYGFGEKADVRGSMPTVSYGASEGQNKPLGMEFTVTYQGESMPIFLKGVLGVQPATSALAAVAVGVARGVPLVEIAANIRRIELPRGRMRLIAGKQGATLIDDSYNSSPVALEAALHTLRDLKGGRKIAALGDMLELGEHSEKEHTRMGTLAAKVVDELVTVGKRAHMFATAAKAAGLSPEHIHEFDDSATAGKWLTSIVQEGDIVLAKGSQGSGKNMIRMERVVKALMKDEEEAADTLVRQEPEWLKQYK